MRPAAKRFRIFAGLLMRASISQLKRLSPDGHLPGALYYPELWATKYTSRFCIFLARRMPSTEFVTVSQGAGTTFP